MDRSNNYSVTILRPQSGRRRSQSNQIMDSSIFDMSPRLRIFSRREENSMQHVISPQLARRRKRSSTTNGYFISGNPSSYSSDPTPPSSRTAEPMVTPRPERTMLPTPSASPTPNVSVVVTSVDPGQTTDTSPAPITSRSTDEMVNFNQFLSQHNWPASPSRALSSSSARHVDFAIEQMMQKSIAIRKERMSREQNTTNHSATQQAANSEPTEPAASQDFTAFLKMLVQRISCYGTLAEAPVEESEQDSARPSLKAEVDVCVICLVNPKEYCIPTCNHLCLCQECSDMFQPNDEETADIYNKCPLCRKPIQGPPFKIYR